MSFLLYGANGYSGRLIAEEAVRQGLRPILAGRNAEAVALLAEELSLPWTAVRLDDSAALRRALDDVPAVVHAAGPFIYTYRPMLEACLATGTHYLDITGEIAVFEAMAAADPRAREAGIALLPGVGFDVVPTDCLAAHLHHRLPAADTLRLAFHTRGGMSHGTALTAIEGLGRPGAVRQGGRIVPVPPAWRDIEVDFGDGKPRLAATIPWGDVSTAFHSTGIPNIEVYLAMSAGRIRSLRRSRWLAPVLRSGPVRWLARRMVDARPAGPDPAAREAGWSKFWGEATSPDGHRRISRISGPEGYTLTARTAVAAATRLLAEPRTGFLTPSRAFGPDFVLDVPGFTREDL